MTLLLVYETVYHNKTVELPTNKLYGFFFTLHFLLHNLLHLYQKKYILQFCTRETLKTINKYYLNTISDNILVTSQQ